ncbi:g-protein alpha subunit, partial [Ancylostoma caninum]
MRVLLDARNKLNIPWEKVERQENVPKIMKFTVADLLKGIDYTTFADVAPVIRDFWEDAAVKQAYEQRNLFQISDSCQYFFDHLSRIAMPNFHPTNKDILYCRKATRGICEHTFDINKIPFRFIDVGGQRSQRQKWFQCFTDITSILFMVASNEYDQVFNFFELEHISAFIPIPIPYLFDMVLSKVILEDRRTNRVVESRSVFETIVNNRAFTNVSIILFMNKSDLLKGESSQSVSFFLFIFFLFLSLSLFSSRLKSGS